MTEIIKISDNIKNELNDLMTDADYDQIISKVLRLIPTGDEEGEYTPEFRKELLNAKLEVIEGDTIDHDEVKEILGIID